jgi:hypothetical protein
MATAFWKKGRTGLSPHLGRQPTGIFSKASAELKQTIIQLRIAHLGWGPTTLLVALGKTAPWASSQLPSRAVLAAFLKQCGLTRHYQPHTALVGVKRGWTIGTGPLLLKIGRNSWDWFISECIMLWQKNRSSKSGPIGGVRKIRSILGHNN